MRTRTRHLLHLAAVALLLYLFALTARFLGVTVAFAIFLPLAIVVELRFWLTLFTSIGTGVNGRIDRPD